MILSRTLAKHRIASGEHPKWVAAWLPVVVDGAVLFTILYLALPWVTDFLDGSRLGLVFAFFFLFYFVPIQIILIWSALWAAKSRNTHDDNDQRPE